ncbi:hypothetical protein JCM10212_006966 [Sporobolomyces blumeae]
MPSKAKTSNRPTPATLDKGKQRAVAIDPITRSSSSSSTHARKARRAELAALDKVKTSNRPRAASASSSSATESDDDAADDDDDDEQDERSRMLRALEAHQASFLASALPGSSGSTPLGRGGGGAAPRDGTAKQAKSVWDMGMDDLEDEEEDDDDDDASDESESKPGRAEDQDEDGAGSSRTPKRVAEVIAFSEPGRNLSSLSAGSVTAAVPVNKREFRDFMSGKVKTNVFKKPSVADEANQKYVGRKGGLARSGTAGSTASEGATGGRGAEDGAEDAQEEAHLSKLDSHLSSLTKSLATNTASLPDLLRELPIESAKPLKGHTPLPKNAPRLLRRGQNAANLKRAQARDDAAGILPGAKRGREALSLKEKRAEEGSDKRQRGMKGAVGKFGRGQISLSKDEIRRVQGMGGGSSRGEGSRGGSGGGGGKKARR